MDPNAPKDVPVVDVKALVDEPMSPEELERFLNEFAPKLPEPERWPQICILDNGDMPYEALLRLRDVAMGHKIDVIMPDMPILEKVAELHEPKRERVVLVGAGAGLSITKLLEKLIREMPIEAPEPERPFLEAMEEAPEKLQLVRQLPKGGRPSFKQFQNARHNHGPSQRRQFAQIRPPRRGGR